jgi:hypothetical protein
VLVEKLTGHLVREIVAGGSRGGPLFPLACQLNHDLLQLEGEQIKGMMGGGPGHAGPPGRHQFTRSANRLWLSL